MTDTAANPPGPAPDERSLALLAEMVPHLANLSDAHSFEPTISELSGIDADHLDAILSEVCDNANPAHQLADILDDPVDRVQRYADFQRIAITFGMVVGMHLAASVRKWDDDHPQAQR